jgi:hypothetical protein
MGMRIEVWVDCGQFWMQARAWRDADGPFALFEQERYAARATRLGTFTGQAYVVVRP